MKIRTRSWKRCAIVLVAFEGKASERKIPEMIRGELRSGIECSKMRHQKSRLLDFQVHKVVLLLPQTNSGTNLERHVHGCLALRIISIW